MDSEHAIPQEHQEKTQGDKLDHAVSSVPDTGTGITQSTPGKATDGTEPEPQQEPLK